MPEPSYQLARAQRGPKITMGKGMHRVEPEDPMKGVTDPAKLLKSDTQRIDKNTYTPEQMWKAAPKTGTESEVSGSRVQQI